MFLQIFLTLREVHADAIPNRYVFDQSSSRSKETARAQNVSPVHTLSMWPGQPISGVLYEGDTAGKVQQR